MAKEKNFCACCGEEIGSFGAYCQECKEHVSWDYNLPAYERTYFGQHGEDCPFQVSSTATEHSTAPDRPTVGG